MFNEMKLSAWSTGVRSKLTVPVRIELWNGRQIDLSGEPPRVTIRLPKPATLRYLLSPSPYSLGRAYVEGAIEVRGRGADMIAVANTLATSFNPKKRTPLQRFTRHTRHKDREAVPLHYDVSNDFYRAWLDPAMVYSCAYFENGDEDLATAQSKKIDHILSKLDLRPGHTLLDIGCGWGALAIRAAGRFGVRCVGITLSENQCLLARERVKQAGLDHLVEIRRQDYRDVKGPFDRITSVGMFEHVGLQYLDAYFTRVQALLAPGGVVMNQGITRTRAENGATPYCGGDFIDEYVFPQGELVHLSSVVKAMQVGGLEVRDVENLRRHYARTCMLWNENFERNATSIAFMTDPRRFRIWRLYLAGCAYAFQHDWISLYQVVCGKAGQSPEQMAWSRRGMYT
ncbi:cyclopropane-fatty-acyl-phospholipid synthase family protein [Massilia sp. S19_KUP03_FR1]|uniref:cyclopropane-fatty-acyl-phospholipid synthase family protein n=1 Tax=Massilia sp. S19_KUP03_FR1 TaxID=3025503 RepID=UPI002FCDBFC9